MGYIRGGAANGHCVLGFSWGTLVHYKFVLVNTSTATDEAQWILPPPVIVGRSSSADVTIGDPSISRRHCQFVIDSQDALVVRDLGSMNGVYVDNQRVKKKAVLRPGSLVQIGAVTLRIEWTEEAVEDRSDFGQSCEITTTQPFNVIKSDQIRKLRDKDQ